MPEAHSGRLWALAFVLITLFVWGLEQVAVMPLQTGEVYPYYSSLRADPLGAKALYESLAALPELDVSRLYKQRSVLDAGTTLLVLGVDEGSWAEITDKTLAEYEHLLAKGGRLVIAFLPVRGPPLSGAPEVVKAKWNVRLAYRRQRAEDSTNAALPRRSALFFEAGPEWSTLAQREDQATAAERPLGGGTLVLAAESYPLSNEGLRESRDAVLIAKLIGPARRVVFDENHLGVAEQGSVGGLMRKYRLEGALAVLLVVAGLFVWRSASSFLPLRILSREQSVAGRDSQEGLTSLLRRSVTSEELLGACYREWSRSGPSPREAERVGAEIARWDKRRPVEAYRAACRVLTETK